MNMRSIGKSLFSVSMLFVVASCASRGGENPPEKHTGITWLMIQDSAGVQFSFDNPINEQAQKQGALWSGRMTLTEVDAHNLWFADRPKDEGFRMPTSKFATRFSDIFESNFPSAIVSWEDPNSKEGSPGLSSPIRTVAPPWPLLSQEA